MSEDKKGVSPDDLGETKSFTIDNNQIQNDTSEVLVNTEEAIESSANDTAKSETVTITASTSSATIESEEAESAPQKKELKKPLMITLIVILAVALLGIGGYFAWTSGFVNIDKSGIELYFGAELADTPEALIETFIQGISDRDPSEIVKAYPPELQDKYHSDRASRSKLHQTLSSGIGAYPPEKMSFEIISKSPMNEEQLRSARKYAAGNASPLSMPSMSDVTDGYILICCVTVDTVTRQETVPVVLTRKGWCITPDFAFGIK